MSEKKKERKSITLRLPYILHGKIEDLAAERMLHTSQLINQLILDALPQKDQLEVMEVLREEIKHVDEY